MRFLLLALVCGTGLFAQTAVVAVPSSPQLQSSSRHARPAIAVPILGFLLASDGNGLVPLRGLSSAPSAGETIAEPAGVGRIFLPPRQHYALVEQTPGSVAVWHLAIRSANTSREVLSLIPGVQAGADIVTFSPTGKAVALYYAAKEKVQVITGLPGMPAVQPSLSAHSSSQFTTLLVSDDGQVVAGFSANISALSCHGAPLRAMPWTYAMRTAAFISNSHSLLISDSRQKQLVLLENVDAQNSSPVVIGNALEPDHLSACSHGDSIVALDSIHQKLWQIDAASLAVTSIPLAQDADMLVSLHDGHTFLLSVSPLSMVRIGDSALRSGNQ